MKHSWVIVCLDLAGIGTNAVVDMFMLSIDEARTRRWIKMIIGFMLRERWMRKMAST